MNDRERDMPAQNTDRELWREREGDHYADSIYVTEGGGIGMNVGGIVVVLPIREWHALAPARSLPPESNLDAVVAQLRKWALTNVGDDRDDDGKPFGYCDYCEAYGPHKLHVTHRDDCPVGYALALSAVGSLEGGKEPRA